MAVYEEIPGVNGGLLSQSEVGIYGSSRLGLWRPMRDVESTNWWLQSQEVMNGTDGISTRSWTRGAMNFELSNHLGNVLVTVSDRRIQVQDNGSVLNPKPVLRFDPDVLTANDYYPGGMQIPGRTYTNGSSYKYGFNGKEKDDEMKGEGNSYDFGARMYDPRISRWLSVDPLQYKYPGLTPYNFVANSPLNAIDPDGKLIIFINGLWGAPMGAGKGGKVGYWGPGWVQRTQKAIGDKKDPLYYDGSMGGTMHFEGKSSLYEKNRIAAGKAMGYKEAKAIIDKLDKDETIKFITNSMGAAFERGFSEGLLKYKDERLSEIGGELFMAGLQINDLEKKISADRVKALNQGILIEPQTEFEKQYRNITIRIADLNNEKEKLQKVEIEMVIDLSAHQTDYFDPNATSNYYMTAEENITYGEHLLGVDEKKHIRHSKYIGKMDGHHSSFADPNKFPKAKKPN